MPINATYLRKQAHKYVALARKCPHLPTSQALEALGVEFMERAAELERSASLTPSSQSLTPSTSQKSSKRK